MKNKKPNFMRRFIIRSTSEIAKIVKPIDSYIMENKCNIKYLQYPPIFIIGAPRTGSTLVYQVLTNYFDIKYISNFSASFYHSLYLGMILSDRILGNSSHNLFDSHYGMASNLNGPNECGQFWYRWFPKDRHFISSNEITKNELIGIRKTIGMITKKFHKPIIFKNLNNGQRLQAIKKILPESLFVIVRRDPVYTAQSILAGRNDFYGDKMAWFSVMPKNVNEIKKNDYPEQVVQQVYFLEKQIFEDINLFPDRQHITIHYETFCKNTIAELERLEMFFRQNNISVLRKENIILPKFKIDKRRLVSYEDFQLIKKEAAKVAWEFAIR